MDHALGQIADRTLNLCNASGIAIALLDGNQLVYRAGSGIAAKDVGRHVPAVLTMCTPNKAGVEILRVENARTDSRIEAAICRQFGATSLLILPVYQAQALAGVLQVHFIEPHTFLDEEVRTYRLMAGLVEEAMFRNVQPGQKDLAEESMPVVPAITQNRPQEQRSRGSDDHLVPAEPNPGQPFGEHVTTGSTVFAKWGPIPIHWKAYRLSIVKFWQIGAALTAAMSFALAIFLAHSYHPAPTTSGSVVSPSNDNASPTPDNPSPIPQQPVSASDNSQGTTNGLKEAMAPTSAFRRVRIGPNEVDYIAEDVTIRNFTDQTRIKLQEVNIGQDVTVRYFVHQSTLSHTAPTPLPTQTSEHPSLDSQ